MSGQTLIETAVKEVIDGIDAYDLLKHGAPDDEFETEKEMILQRINSQSSIEKIASVISDVMNESFGFETDHKRYVKEAEQIYWKMH